MNWFGSSKQDCEKDLANVNKRLVDVETRLLKLELEQGVFRNAVLRKLQRARVIDSIEPETTSEAESKHLYSGVLIPEKE